MNGVTRSAGAVDDHVLGDARRLISISHRLHADPEIAWQEHRSSALLAAELTESGFDVQRGIGGLATAFRAERPAVAPSLCGVGSRPVSVAFVAEYDALAGLGHACGHNIIAAAAVGAAEALAAVVPDVSVSVIGTPAEEGGGGKIYLLDAGVFDDVDMAMMIHPGPDDALYAFPYAVAHMDIRYRGLGAHAAAYPHLGRNAADAFTIAQVAIGLLRQQLPGEARVHGIVRSAGDAPNAIPESSDGHWYIRARSLVALDELVERVLDCFRAGALATGCELQYAETSPRYSDFCNDERLAESFDRHAAERGRTMLRGSTGMNTASTDMGNVSHRVRAIHPYLSIDCGDAVNHQREFADASATSGADKAVLDGAILLARTAFDEVKGHQE